MKRIAWLAWRVVFAITAAFALQVTVAPYLRIAGIAPDLLLVSIAAIAISLANDDDGIVWRSLVGLIVGFYAALLVETTGKEPPGLTTATFALSGAAACILPPYIKSKLHPGRWSRRARERLVSYFPFIMAAALTVFKETLMTVFFYLRGVSLTQVHIVRVLLATAYNTAAALIGARLLVYWVHTEPAGTLVAKARKRREEARRRRAIRGIRRKLPDMPNVPPPKIKAKPIDD